MLTDRRIDRLTDGRSCRRTQRINEIFSLAWRIFTTQYLCVFHLKCNIMDFKLMQRCKDVSSSLSVLFNFHFSTLLLLSKSLAERRKDLAATRRITAFSNQFCLALSITACPTFTKPPRSSKGLRCKGEETNDRLFSYSLPFPKLFPNHLAPRPPNRSFFSKSETRDLLQK